MNTYVCNKCGQRFSGEEYIRHGCRPPEEKPWPTHHYEEQGTAYDPNAKGYELQGRKKAPACGPERIGPKRSKLESDILSCLVPAELTKEWKATEREFWTGDEIMRFNDWWGERWKLPFHAGETALQAWKAAKEDALSVARQSDSRRAPEPAANRFDSDATDQVELGVNP